VSAGESASACADGATGTTCEQGRVSRQAGAAVAVFVTVCMAEGVPTVGRPWQGHVPMGEHPGARGGARPSRPITYTFPSKHHVARFIFTRPAPTHPTPSSLLSLYRAHDACL
jgi:hypothetical protein